VDTDSSVLEHVVSVKTDNFRDWRDCLRSMHIEGKVARVNDGNIGALVVILSGNRPQRMRDNLWKIFLSHS